MNCTQPVQYSAFKITLLKTVPNCKMQKSVEKNVNKKAGKIFYLAKNLFNIVYGNFGFHYLLTQSHISPAFLRGFFFVVAFRKTTRLMQELG